MFISACKIAAADCLPAFAALLLLAQAGHAQDLATQTLASGLEHPWAVAFLPEGRFLVTERPGRMRIVSADGAIGTALPGVPQVAAAGKGGLLDVVLDSASSCGVMTTALVCTSGTGVADEARNHCCGTPAALQIAFQTPWKG